MLRSIVISIPEFRSTFVKIYIISKKRPTLPVWAILIYHHCRDKNRPIFDRGIQ